MSIGLVAIKNKNGTIRASYMGDVDDADKMLYMYYLTTNRVNQLLDLGSIDGVGQYLNPSIKGSAKKIAGGNKFYDSLESFMNEIYSSAIIIDPTYDVYVFDEETEQWMYASHMAKKLITLKEKLLFQHGASLEELQEYSTFVASLLPKEVVGKWISNGKVYNQFSNDFPKTREIFYYLEKLDELEGDMKEAAENGNYLKCDSSDLEDEDVLADIMETIHGQSRKPEIIDFIFSQMKNMSYEEILEKIVKNGLGFEEPSMSEGIKKL